MCDYERLTKKDIDYTSECALPTLRSLSIGQSLNRLAAYEDTGLSPELCAELAGIPTWRLRMLAEADKDRRCVVCASREAAERMAEEAFAEAFCNLMELPADAWLEKEAEHGTD